MTSRPVPSQKIASALRHRIEAGELGPGAQIPSTREIAREWGVAIATATKALGVLRAEGLIQSRPRTRTVVTLRPGANVRSSQTKPSRDAAMRDRIVQAGIAIADLEGLDAVSMRRVAARIGGAPMSLYRSVNGKEDLVLLMVDAVFGEAVLPSSPAAAWRPRLDYVARALWSLYRAHPWLAQTHALTRPLLLPNLLRLAEWALSALDGHGFKAAVMLDLHILLFGSVQSVAVHLEQEREAQAVTGKTADEWMVERFPAFKQLVSSGRYPTFARLVAAGDYDLRLDSLFELNLKLMLEGIADLIRRQVR